VGSVSTSKNATDIIRGNLMAWYLAKSIEIYKLAEDETKYPCLFDENIYLIEAATLREAKSSAAAFAKEKAAVWTSPLYIGGAEGRIVAAGFRAIEMLESAVIETNCVLSRSLYQPIEQGEMSLFVEQCKAIKVIYFGQDDRFRLERKSNLFKPSNFCSVGNFEEPWWHAAHLVYSLTSKDSKALILEEIVVLEALTDDWREAEAFGAACYGTGSLAYVDGVSYEVHFEGIRQVNLIPDATVGIGLKDFAEISYSKFEIGSSQELEQLLTNKDCLVDLLPASVSNLQL
jgi:hypothetical protein